MFDTCTAAESFELKDERCFLIIFFFNMTSLFFTQHFRQKVPASQLLNHHIQIKSLLLMLFLQSLFLRLDKLLKSQQRDEVLRNHEIYYFETLVYLC